MAMFCSHSFKNNFHTQLFPLLLVTSLWGGKISLPPGKSEGIEWDRQEVSEVGEGTCLIKGAC